MGIINWENESRDSTLGAACPTNSGIIQKTTENPHMKGDYETHLVPHQRRISSLEFLVFIVKIIKVRVFQKNGTFVINA